MPRRPGVVLVSREATAEQPWRAAEAIGAEHVALLPSAGPWLADRFADTADTRPGATGRIITVIGGRGGAGASVLAAGLAVTGARAGLRALLVDADPLGGGIDLLLGWEAADGLRWPSLTETSGPVPPPALVDALPGRGDLSVLSCDRSDQVEVPLAAMATTLDAGRLGQHLVVVDLPRNLNDAATLAISMADLVLMVVPAEIRACAAAARVAARVAAHTEALSVVVRGPAPGRLRARDISRALGLPAVGTLRPEPEIARGIERGDPPAASGRGPLAGLCQRLLTELGLFGSAAS